MVLQSISTTQGTKFKGRMQDQIQAHGKIT
jgi:hypothetical protein